MKKLTWSLSVMVLAGLLPWASAGDLTGKITLKGTPPTPLTIPYDDNCSKLNPTILTTRWYVVGKDNGLANVFVYISKGLEGKKFPIPTKVVELDQVGCNYNPYIFGVMVGQPVRIKDSDPSPPIIHNIHGIPNVDGNEGFNFAQTSQGDMNDTIWLEKIKKPEVLVKIKCDVHQWMFAYGGVCAHPFFAVSDADGNFKIANVPAGKYTLTAYHLKAHGDKPGETQEITVADGPATANFTVEVPAP
jgi:hypothetical protein